MDRSWSPHTSVYVQTEQGWVGRLGSPDTQEPRVPRVEVEVQSGPGVAGLVWATMPPSGVSPAGTTREAEKWQRRTGPCTWLGGRGCGLQSSCLIHSDTHAAISLGS